MDGPIWTARIRGSGPLPRPPALDAPIPATAAAMDEAGAPPRFRVQVRGRLPGGLDAVVPWLEDAPADVLDAVGPKPDRIACAQLRARFDGRAVAGPTSETFLLAYLLAGCGHHEDAGRMASDAASDEAAVRWAVRRGSFAPTPAVGLERAPGLAAEHGAEDDVIRLVEQLCETDRPDLAAGLRAVLDAAPTPEDRQDLAATCGNQSDPFLAAAHSDACDALACADALDVLADLDASAEHPSVGLPPLLARYPALRSGILDAAERCALDPDGPYRAHCLYTLAEADWPRAARIAGTRPAEADPVLAALAAALTLPDPAALHHRLVGAGLPDGATRDPDLDPHPPTTREWLARRDRVLVVEDGTPGWAGWAAELAAVRSGALPDARFEHIEGSHEGAAALRGWLGDRRWHARLPYDGSGPARVVALLNAMAAERRVTTRFVLLADTPVALTWGPEDALMALADERLLAAADIEDHWPAPAP